MNTAGVNSEPERPSRLVPEPVARRDFLGLVALWSAGAAMLFALFGALRLPKVAVLPSPSKRFRVELPESLGEGDPFVPAGRSVALFRNSGAVYAVSTICTHLGCVIKPTPDGFDCPCHGSRFATDGTVLKGPAPHALPWLAVERTGERTYTVDEGKTVPLGTKELA